MERIVSWEKIEASNRSRCRLSIYYAAILSTMENRGTFVVDQQGQGLKFLLSRGPLKDAISSFCFSFSPC